jgi:hypothetical protein
VILVRFTSLKLFNILIYYPQIIKNKIGLSIDNKYTNIHLPKSSLMIGFWDSSFIHPQILQWSMYLIEIKTIISKIFMKFTNIEKAMMIDFEEYDDY